MRHPSDDDSGRERDLALIIRALRDIGLPVQSSDDLTNTSRPYPEAIPVLVDLLSRSLHPDAIEVIVRSLTVREARGIAGKALLRKFVEFGHKDIESRIGGLQWSIGNALSVVADDGLSEELLHVVSDRSYGRTREMIAIALARSKDPRTVEVLVNLLKNDEIPGHAIIALGKVKAAEARPFIERYLTHTHAWVRTEARRALAKIDRALAKRSRA